MNDQTAVINSSESILLNFRRIRTHTLKICQPLQTEDYVPQISTFSSPPKWHLAHTTWFFEEMILKKYFTDYQEFNSMFGFLFNSYYNTIGERTKRAERGHITRPSVKEIYEYREYIDKQIEEFLSADVQSEVLDLMELGLNHEQQHQELLLTDLKFNLSNNPVYPVYIDNYEFESTQNSSCGWLSVEEGIYLIGNLGSKFCFDNELNRHKVYLNDYQISKALVTNQEYIEFIESGGYLNFNFWLDEALLWLENNQITHPLYWRKIKGKWFEYTLGGMKPLNMSNQLCHISYYEAAAYAEWKSCRLPTEAEWEVASSKLSWGNRWEWTNSAYLPYPGFKKSEGVVGEYNGKFMINQMVLKGASIATSEGHSRNTYRNFFHPNSRWQFSGIRLAK